MKVVIIGGGVAGLAIGWRLAQSGCEVEVFERGLAGRGATWASGGMIAAVSETGADDGALARFAEEARAQWPAFAREIETASGKNLSYRDQGALLIALDGAQETRLRQLANSLSERQMPGKWLGPAEARKFEPLLAPNLRGALHALDAAQIDNRALGGALSQALRNAGGQLQENVDAHLLVVEKNHARGLITDKGIVLADAVVVAGGAWSNSLGAVPSDLLPPVRPVKGQMAALVPPNGAEAPQYPAWESDVYIVPRRDGVLLGATVDEAGFDTSVTREARDWLVTNAVKLMPSLSQWKVSESWAGLRPATPDGLPVLGPTRLDGLFVASGQFRNGILFGPAVADVLRRAVLGEEIDPYLRAFDPGRFFHGPN